MKIKNLLINTKRVFIFFSVCFTVLFLLFSFEAIFSIARYRVVNFWNNIGGELRRPISFDPERPAVTTERTSNNQFWNDHLSVEQFRVRQPLPDLPEKALYDNLLVLPKFNIEVPILEVTNENEKIIYEALRKGVLVYPTTQVPSSNSNYTIILGHSSRYPWEPGRFRSVFSLLNEFEIGDQFFVFYNQKPLVYQITNKEIFLPFPKGEDFTENIFPASSDEQILILQTCWPVGVDYKRIAVKAVLVNW